ncbi:MAG: Efflux ABC transporter, permease/ATP-binding protein [uncultured Gemmatimonadaceae bacterium]|uniref:Efflux ABC transporter, permease/ATP-binding protein n=1 Tax=uncultured Gemmatimonadaceae bacterium TaxID=246130 RepID=A0A6J4KUS6_9BACT|nr:MAG: Efflux ABC transporter, permease/ATP-binding protein [uncultured Gemmatimonadaceae bacterium]
MLGVVACNIGAAVLDVFSFTLLIPFLNALFRQPALPTKPGLVTSALTWTVGRLLDPADQMASLRNIILVILTTVAAKNLLAWLAGQLGAQLQEFVTRDLRNAVYGHLQRLPLGYFARTKTGQILARVLADTAQTKQVITDLVTRSLQSGAVVLTTVAALFAISWRLTLLALVVAPLLVAALQPLLRRLRTGHRRLGDQQGELTAIVQESVSGIRLVKSFRGEAYETQRFMAASNRLAKGLTRVSRLAYLAQPITETIGTAIAVALLWVGARQVLVENAFSGATLITFLILVMRMLQPLKQLSQVYTSAQASLAAASRVFDILDAPVELDRGTRPVPAFRQALAFEDVSFAYEPGGERVLANVSFAARRGDVVALVGASGAGKSTLVDLIPRFYEPTEGRITLDGVDTRELRLAELRALTGIVSQDTVLFNDTVRANVAYGAGDRYSDAQVEAAARAANAHDFIAALPEGYATVLGERGTRLSGGQRQRIAIARALLVDPPILILDEATSALDTESERLVQEAIDRLLAGRTVFVIAHRLSTVANATQILVLDRGRVVERGTHAELLARRGAYWRLHSLQFGERVGVGA